MNAHLKAYEAAVGLRAGFNGRDERWRAVWTDEFVVMVQLEGSPVPWGLI